MILQDKGEKGRELSRTEKDVNFVRIGITVH